MAEPQGQLPDVETKQELLDEIVLRDESTQVETRFAAEQLHLPAEGVDDADAPMRMQMQMQMPTGKLTKKRMQTQTQLD